MLERKLSSLVNQDYTIVGGIDSIVNILNSVDRATEKRIMESLEVESNLSLQKKSEKKMFVFEDICSWTTGLSRECSAMWRMRILSLHFYRGSTNVIFRLSKRLAAMIKDMDFMGPVRMKDVEEAQQKDRCCYQA